MEEDEVVDLETVSVLVGKKGQLTYEPNVTTNGEMARAWALLPSDGVAGAPYAEHTGDCLVYTFDCH